MDIYCTRLDCKKSIKTPPAILYGIPFTCPSGQPASVQITLCEECYNTLLLWISGLADIKDNEEISTTG